MQKIKNEFERYKEKKREELKRMREETASKYEQKEREIKQKEDRMKVQESKLREREKALTDLIMRTEGAEDLKSFNKTLNFDDFGGSKLDFDDFLGQFEVHKKELKDRERALSRFLREDGSVRTSTNSSIFEKH